MEAGLGHWLILTAFSCALELVQICVALTYPACATQVLFALCSLLRHFPYAQQQFLKLGGLQVLRSLVQEKNAKVLAVRVVTLLYDLVTEKVSACTCSAFPFILLCVHFWSFNQSTLPNASVQHLGQNGWTDGQIAKMCIKKDVI